MATNAFRLARWKSGPDCRRNVGRRAVTAPVEGDSRNSARHSSRGGGWVRGKQQQFDSQNWRHSGRKLHCHCHRNQRQHDTHDQCVSDSTVNSVCAVDPHKCEKTL
jgi:hypothetical protein